MRKLLVLLLLLLVSLAGCTSPADSGDDPADPDGNDADSGAGDEFPEDAPTMSVDIAAIGFYPANPSFSELRIEVEAGTILTVTYTNEDTNPFINHDLKFDGVEEQTPSIAPGDSTELVFLVDLEPGEYPYYCAIGNHREQGMEGVLVVS